MSEDARFMALALAQCEAASIANEVPVGAVVVKDGKVIAVGRNAPIGQHDPSAHAEIVALRAAAIALQNYRLDGCDIYVTLEPCAMCAGAMLHARIQRVVFGAADPKTGAAGSVINLFAQPQLNHQTTVLGGVLQAPCAQVLQDFFRSKRSEQARRHAPLREDALRTPAQRFHDLPDYPWEGHFVHDLPVLDGLRMHYLDEGPAEAPLTFLCLHNSPGWSYDYRFLLPSWVGAGQRVVAPDWIGFGQSDKPKRASAHTLEFHRQTVLQLIEHLDLRNIVLVVQGDDPLGCSLPTAQAERYRGMLILGAHPATRPVSAEQAPFPDAGHQAAVRMFPQLQQEAAGARYPAWSGKTVSLEMNETTAQAALDCFAAG